ncbi:SGNH/GDSL hydrolase family protein [Labilibacter sediminis]|nr:SGNH/GDSL hydrolase family protein [Labilibacter sediminis]
MKRSKLNILLIILISIIHIGITAQTKNIKLDNKNIYVAGANYVNASAKQLHYSRFSEATLKAPRQETMFMPKKAMTTSGVKIRFKTNSSKVKLTFTPLEGDNRGSEFAVLQNGETLEKFDFKGQSGKADMRFDIINRYPNKETLFEVVLPSWANPALTGMQIDMDSELVNIKETRKPIYLALGNSITHGVGQGSASYLSYPYLLAQKLDIEYYNLAVGGAKISPAIAAQTAEMPQADIITILIGYNGMAFSNKTPEEYRNDYISYLSEIRKNQPQATIYCISLTHTKFVKNEKTGATPQDFRMTLESLVKERIADGDKKLVFIDGKSITSVANLRADQPKDLVHFGIEGAALFADELYQIISNR